MNNIQQKVRNTVSGKLNILWLSYIKRIIQDYAVYHKMCWKYKATYSILKIYRKAQNTDIGRAQNEPNTWEQSGRQSGLYLFRALTKWNSEKSNKLRGDAAVRMLTHIRWTANPKSRSGFIVKNVSEASFDLLPVTKGKRVPTALNKTDMWLLWHGLQNWDSPITINWERKVNSWQIVKPSNLQSLDLQMKIRWWHISVASLGKQLGHDIEVVWNVCQQGRLVSTRRG